ncbi:MAG TPA: hypothetical protein VFL47_12480, partial [Flavisolibacter sp.]|nr:hypothetical protein [Flavisolibacter sp.]
MILNLNKRWLIFLQTVMVVTSFAHAAGYPTAFKIYSPSKKIVVNVFVSKDRDLFYSVDAGNGSILKNSSLGISVDGNDLGKEVVMMA